MNLSRIILGLLAIEPMTGYDLKRHFDSSVRHFWWADKSQIYRTLATLVSDGYAEVETIAGRGAPDRQVHRITDSGREALARWLVSPPEKQPSRHPFLARLFFADDLEDAQLHDILAERRTVVSTQLAEYRRLRLKVQAEAEDSRAGRLRLSTLDYGITHAQAELDWLDRTEVSLA